MKSVGTTRWAIAEGYIPGKSTGTGRELTSHEAVCILNAGDRDARVEIMVYFSDREPAGLFTFIVRARRTQHHRFNRFPRSRDDTARHRLCQRRHVGRAPIVVQHTRLDSRQEALALLRIEAA